MLLCVKLLTYNYNVFDKVCSPVTYQRDVGWWHECMKTYETMAYTRETLEVPLWVLLGNSNQIVSTALAEWHVMKLDRQGNEGVGLCTWSNFLANNWQTLGLTRWLTGFQAVEVEKRNGPSPNITNHFINIHQSSQDVLRESLALRKLYPELALRRALGIPEIWCSSTKVDGSEGRSPNHL